MYHSFLVHSSADGHLGCFHVLGPGFDPWVGKIPWRRKWQSTPVLLPGKSHGRRSLVGYSPWGCKESDTTEQLSLPFPRVKKDSLWHETSSSQSTNESKVLFKSIDLFFILLASQLLFLLWISRGQGWWWWGSKQKIQSSSFNDLGLVLNFASSGQFTWKQKHIIYTHMHIFRSRGLKSLIDEKMSNYCW